MQTRRARRSFGEEVPPWVALVSNLSSEPNIRRDNLPPTKSEIGQNIQQ